MAGPDTSIYSLASRDLGQHCVAGAGFDLIRPAAELLCRRETTPEPGVKINQEAQATAVVGEGLKARIAATGSTQSTVGGYDIVTQGGASLNLSSGQGTDFRVGIRADVVGRQGAGPGTVRPYIEVNGSSRDGATVTAGACTDVKVPILPTKVEVCPGVRHNTETGRTTPAVSFSTALNI